MTEKDLPIEVPKVTVEGDVTTIEIPDIDGDGKPEVIKTDDPELAKAIKAVLYIIAITSIIVGAIFGILTKFGVI